MEDIKSILERVENDISIQSLVNHLENNSRDFTDEEVLMHKKAINTISKVKRKRFEFE